jgi:hypothetical protein
MTISVLLVGIVAACSGSSDLNGSAATNTTSTASSIRANSSTLPSNGIPTPELIRMPLTGEVLATASDIPNRPAIAAKLDNSVRARPQAGLNEADVIFEENVESLTRFAAVFHSTGAETVGPIRSGRSQDISILSAFDRPLFAWSGGNDGVRRLVRNSELIDLDAARTSGYYRRAGRSAPHNLYSSTEALWVHAPVTAGPPRQVFEYRGPEAAVGGVPALSVGVEMDGLKVRWQFDSDREVYLRFQDSQPHQTEFSGQVEADTVVVMAVVYRPSSVDRNSPEAQLTGQGPVVVFSDGLAQVGTWFRESISEPYRFRLLNGEPLLLSPGRTFVHLARDREGFATWE